MLKNVNLSPEDAKKIKEIMDDPVKWAQIFIISTDNSTKKSGPWVARNYQAKVLRDKKRKKVLRWGRRMGKCLPGWVRVIDPITGKLVKVSDLYDSQEASVITMSHKLGLTIAHTDQIFYNGVKEVFRVKLSSGREIDATGNHPLYTINGWQEIDDLKCGDYVAVPTVLNYFGNISKDYEEIKEIAKEIKSTFNLADSKIDDWIFELNRKSMSALIEELSNYKIVSYSERLLLDIQHLFLRFGINTKVKRINKNGDIKYRLYKELRNEMLVLGDIYFERIVSIKSLGYHCTYDLTVDETHNFVANDVIVHNTEVMCIDVLYNMFTQENCRCIIAAPYENQIRLIFMRLKELVESSPLLNQHKVKFTFSPFNFTIDNGSCVLGFTTGAGTGSAAGSVRGQKADRLYLDEMDYMNDADFDALIAIAAERDDITQLISSTPTGRRGKFWQICTDKNMGYEEYHFPSTMNPNWNEAMEADFRNTLSPEGYVHEVLAEFGTEEVGVFNKNKVDIAMTKEYYAYTHLDAIQRGNCEFEGRYPDLLLYDSMNVAPRNMLRTMGCDFDKYGASSSIIIIDFIPEISSFKVIKRVEIPRSEYSYDNAFKTIVELNHIYCPSWIYCDRGSGEYLIERLHLYGEEHPETNLKNKVKGWRFNNSLDILNPVTGAVEKEPLKPFMVNQLSISFDRERIILSPFDQILHKQLIDYTVERISASGQPVYTSENEHFVDALGLAHLAFVLEFPELIKTISIPERTAKVSFTKETPVSKNLREMFATIKNPYKDRHNINDSDDLAGDKPPNIIYNPPLTTKGGQYSASTWGSRNPTRYGRNFRSSW